MGHPNSPSIGLTLLQISSIKDEIGNKTNVIKAKKEVVGITRSITQNEYQTSIQMKVTFDLKVILQCFLYDGSKYAGIDGVIYKIERTYVNGQYIELYLSSADIEVIDNG